MASNIDNCQQCTIKIKDDDKGLQCEFCHLWTCLDCTKVPEEIYNFLTDNRSSNSIGYTCPPCKSDLPILREIKGIKLKYETMEKEIDVLKIKQSENENDITNAMGEIDSMRRFTSSEITDMKSELNAKIDINTQKHEDVTKINESITDIHAVISSKADDLEEIITKKYDGKIDDLKQQISDLKSKASSDTIRRPIYSHHSKNDDERKNNVESEDNATDNELYTKEIVNTVYNNIHDRINRLNNIIIFNLPESESRVRSVIEADDQKHIRNIAHTIKTTIPLSQFETKRLKGRNPNSYPPRPVLVTFKNNENKKEIMKTLHNLKDASDPIYRTISVKHDMTPEERQEESKLKLRAIELNNQNIESDTIHVVRGKPWERKIVKITKLFNKKIPAESQHIKNYNEAKVLLSDIIKKYPEMSKGIPRINMQNNDDQQDSDIVKNNRIETGNIDKTSEQYTHINRIKQRTASDEEAGKSNADVNKKEMSDKQQSKKGTTIDASNATTKEIVVKKTNTKIKTKKQVDKNEASEPTKNIKGKSQEKGNHQNNL